MVYIGLFLFVSLFFLLIFTYIDILYVELFGVDHRAVGVELFLTYLRYSRSLRWTDYDFKKLHFKLLCYQIKQLFLNNPLSLLFILALIVVNKIEPLKNMHYTCTLKERNKRKSLSRSSHKLLS